MEFTGGCYCGEIRYEAKGDPIIKGQCHCRECQTFSGGAPNLFMLMPTDGFRFTKGEPKTFARSDLEQPVTRLFCADCGTHLATKRPHSDIDAMVLKIGTLDDPGQYEQAQMAIFTVDQQPFHIIPDGTPQFERLPPRR